MLKFLLVAFLFMGLAVNGQAEKDEKTELATTEAEAQQKVSLFSEESEESSEEDNSAATYKESLAEDKEEFDQEDDFGSQVMEDATEEQEKEQQDDSGARCWKPRCKNFLRARSNFRRWKRSCKSCLMRKKNYCKRMCTIYRSRRAYRFRYCRRLVYNRLANWRKALKNNWNKIAAANKGMQQNLAYWRWYAKRVSGITMAKAVSERAKQLKIYKANRNAYYANLKKMKAYVKNANANWARRNFWFKQKASSKRTRMIKYYTSKYYYWRRFAIKFNNYRLANAKATNAAARAWRYWNTKVIYIKRMNKYKANYYAWLKQKKALLKQRKNWIKRARNYARAQWRYCMKTVKAYYWRCRLCNASCGRNCNYMQMYYARAIVNAHKCRMQRSLCGRKAFYKKRFYAWSRACAYCLKKTPPKLKLLWCSARCQTKFKYKLIWNYYKTKC